MTASAIFSTAAAGIIAWVLGEWLAASCAAEIARGVVEAMP